MNGKYSLAAFIHRKTLVLHPDDPVENAAKAMDAQGVGSVVVSDREGHLVGIVTDRDLACRLLAHGGSGQKPLASVMTRDPARVEETQSIEAVIDRMAELGIRRIPVVQRVSGGRERCVGMVSLDDLIAARAIDPYHLTRVVRRQIQRRIGANGFHGTAPSSETSHELYRSLARDAGLEPEKARELLLIVVPALGRRLHHTGAMYLAAGLSGELRQRLIEQPAGPDFDVTPARLAADVAESMKVTEEAAEALVFRACEALESWIGYERFDRVKFQLPRELRALFVQRAKAGTRGAA